MIKVPWDLEEAIILVDVFFQNSPSSSLSDDNLDALKYMLWRRAATQGISHDEKYRNTSGLKMQLECIRYVVTEGQVGMSNAGRVFYEAVRLYNENRDKFMEMVRNFYQKYQE